MKIRQLLETDQFKEDSIVLSNRMLTLLPDGIPRELTKYFECDNNKLTSLKGAPELVGRNFWCYNNRLTSLEGAPQSIGGIFWCTNNNLISLKGAPRSVGGNFWCSRNNLTSLEGAPQSVGGNFICHNNPIKSHILGLMLIEIGGTIETQLGNGSDVDKILNKWKNRGRKGVMGAMKELIDLGYEELAQI